MRRAQKAHQRKQVPMRQRAQIKQAGAWFKPPHVEPTKPAPKPTEKKLGKKILKVLRKLSIGYRLTLTATQFRLFAPNLGAAYSKVRAKWVKLLLNMNYLIAGLCGALVLTGAGRAASAGGGR